MNSHVLKPNTCSTCPFKVRQGDFLFCHASPPAAHPIMALGPQGPQMIGLNSVWPQVQPEDWCGKHPAFIGGLVKAVTP